MVALTLGVAGFAIKAVLSIFLVALVHSCRGHLLFWLELTGEYCSLWQNVVPKIVAVAI